jgi:predicted transcriptional regulator of viral defense system
MRSYEIIETLRKSRKAVFTFQDITKITGLNGSGVYVLISRLYKKGWIFKPLKGVISLSQDPFVISSQLYPPSYISLITALYLHGKIPQVIDRIFIVTPRKRRQIKVFGMDVQFVTLRRAMIFGYKKLRKENSYVVVADAEKAIIDCLYLPRYCRLADIIDILEEGDVDIRRLIEYARKSESEAVERRLGYLLDLIGVKHDIRPKNKTSYKLNPSIGEKGEFDNKWRIYVNEAIE